jgi:hypothetical protein
MASAQLKESLRHRTQVHAIATAHANARILGPGRACPQGFSVRRTAFCPGAVALTVAASSVSGMARFNRTASGGTWAVGADDALVSNGPDARR